MFLIMFLDVHPLNLDIFWWYTIYLRIGYANCAQGL